MATGQSRFVDTAGQRFAYVFSGKRSRTSPVLWGAFFFTAACFHNLPAHAQTPTITSLSRSSGQPGDLVTITGSDFAADTADNLVWFGAVAAPVLSSSTTSLDVRVPSGATFAPVSVRVPSGKTASSVSPFSPLFSPTGPITDHSFGQRASFPVTSKPVLVNFSTGFGSPTQGVTICDFDKDGKPDLVAAHWNNGNVVILRNTHTSGNLISASFTAVATLNVGSNPTDISTGDLNGDGQPDLVVANHASDSVSILQNASVTGAISFLSAVSLSVPGLPPASAAPPNSVRIVDVDGDGWLDIMVSGYNVGVFRNKGFGGTLTTGSFEAMVLFSVSGSAAHDMAVADFDNDGKPDILATDAPNQISLLHNSSTPGTITAASFAAPVQFPIASSAAAVAAADLNGDGKIELIAATTGSILHIFPNQCVSGSLTASSFGARVDVSISQSLHSTLRLAVADLNGDALPDILATNRYDPGISVCVNGGASTISASFTLFAGLDIPAGDAGTGMYGRVAVGDLNADGKPDLAVDGEWGKIEVSQNFVQPLTVNSLSVSPTNATTKVPWYRTRNFTVAQVMSDGSSMDVTAAATWTTSAPAVATVNSAGKATGLSVGSTTITSSYGGRSAAATLTVQPTTFGTNPGNPDERFLPVISNGASNGAVYTLAPQPDGKVIIGGAFSSVNGTTRNNLARLNSDGSLDSSFDPGSGPDGSVQDLCLDDAGNILIVGRFSAINGTTCRAVARLFPNGNLDTSFNANLSSSSSLRANVVCTRPDGRILVGGNALRVVGDSATFLLQLNFDGTRDTSFNAISVTSGEASALAIQPNGSVIVGGSFLRDGSLFCIARLNLTGALDDSFFKWVIQTSRVYGIALQPDGKIVAVGDFSGFVTRLNSNGTRDSGFSSPAISGWGIIQAVALQKDGKVLVSKSFTTARLNPNGSLDSSYSTSVSPDWDTRVIVVDRTEKIWVAGGISSVNGSPTMGIARLHGDVTTFLGWQTKYFSMQELADPAISGESGDAAGDGVPNLLKYAVGADAHKTATDLLPISTIARQGVDDFLDFTFRRMRQATDLTYEVGVSNDLQVWDYSGVELEMVGSAVPNSDGLTEKVTMRPHAPLQNFDRLFFRLQVIRNE